MGIFTTGLCAAGNCTTLAPTDEQYSNILATLKESTSPCDERAVSVLYALQYVSQNLPQNTGFPQNMYASPITNRALLIADLKANELLKIDFFMKSNEFSGTGFIKPNASLIFALTSTTNPASNITKRVEAIMVPQVIINPADFTQYKGIFPKTKVHTLYMTKKCLQNYDGFTCQSDIAATSTVMGAFDKQIEYNLSIINPNQ